MNKDLCRCGHRRDDHYKGQCEADHCPCIRWRGQLITLKKMSTAEFRARLVPPLNPGNRCWGAVFDAFGVPYETKNGGRYLHDILSHFHRAGYETKRVKRHDAMPSVTQESAYTLAVFLADRGATGDWLISVSRHVLCVRDGVITDTMGTYQTVARRIEGIYEIVKSEVTN